MHGVGSMGIPAVFLHSMLSRLNRAFTRVRSSRFARDVMAVGGGIAAAQVINLLFAPLLTRLYGPMAFGSAAAFTAVVNILMPIASLGYANAIVQPADDEEASALARLSIACGLVLAPLTLVVVHFGRSWLADLTGLRGASWALYLAPIALLLSAFLTVANQAAIREGLFKAKARAYVETTVLTNLAKLAGGWFGPSGAILIVLTLAGNGLNVLLQLIRVKRSGVLRPSRWFGTSGVRQAASAHRDFALYRMPQNIINSASFGLPVIMMTSLFGAAAAGQYSLTLMAMSAPVLLLGQSVGDVFYPKITRAIQRDEEEAARLVRRATKLLALLGAVPFGVVCIFGDRIFPLVFGGQWHRAGEYSQWIAVWMVCVLATRPAVAAVPALRMQGVLLAYEVVITVARVSTLYIGFALGDDLTSVAAFSVVNVLGYASLLALVLLKLRPSTKERQPC